MGQVFIVDNEELIRLGSGECCQQKEEQDTSEAFQHFALPRQQN
jgi:hypothetical protein